MANEEQLAILRQGVEVWNAWRQENPNVQPDQSGVDLTGMDLEGADLIRADLSEADLSEANLNVSNLSGANLRRANLSRTRLYRAEIYQADLSEADCSEADLREAVFNSTVLKGTVVRQAHIASTTFANIDLSLVHALETVRHSSPATLGIDTLIHSDGKIPETFLRGCGVPDSFIEYLPSLLGAMQPIQFYSCFISYSSKDEDFARRLHQRMQAEHLRVWFAPEDIKGGERIHEQIERAIQLHDRLLLVLSEHSIRSQWVQQELRRARRVELTSQRRKLFPIRLIDLEALQEWECLDSRTGSDLAEEIRQYFIPDFTRWKEHDAFEYTFARLMRDLRAVDQPPIQAMLSTESPRSAPTISETKQRQPPMIEEQQAEQGDNTLR